LLVNDTFIDEGAVAEDETDGDVTASIEVGGDLVDVATAGTYTITYDVSDVAGNSAVQQTRTVTVEEEVVVVEEPVVTDQQTSATTTPQT